MHVTSSSSGFFLAIAACSVLHTSAFTPISGMALRSSPISSLHRSGVSVAPTRASRSAVKMQEQQNPALERVVACLPYALPLADGFEWGRYVFEQFPLAALPFVPLFPVMQLLNAPFVSFAIFIALFSFVTRNPNLSRFVRFNTLQAIYLDIALIFPQLLKGMGATLAFPPVIGVPLSNCVFYAMAGSVGYALYKNARGELPNEIPVISESVESQMPF